MERFVKTSTLTSKPKDQRSIIADILLGAKKPLSISEIAAQARGARYDERMKHGPMDVTVEESIEYHIAHMLKTGDVKSSN